MINPLISRKSSPKNISGMKMWLDAARITGLSNNDPVTTWEDISGNGNSATQATSANKPLYKTGIQNGRPGVYFDGVDDYIQSLTLSLTQPCTYFAVFDTDDIANAGYVFAGTSLAESNSLYGTVGGVLNYYAGASLSAVVAHPTASPIIATVVYNGASSSFRENGGQTSAGNAGANNLSAGINIGASHATNEHMQGHILELIVYDKTLSQREAGIVERHLSKKYNIGLA